MGIFGSILGEFGSALLDPVRALNHYLGNGSDDSSASGSGQPDPNAGLIAMAEASRDTQIVQSNNNLLAMQTQAAVMELGILENSKNAQFQTLAWLTERLDANDTKLQIAVENAKLHMTEEANRHVEAMEDLRIDARELEIRELEAARSNEISTFSMMA